MLQIIFDADLTWVPACKTIFQMCQTNKQAILPWKTTSIFSATSNRHQNLAHMNTSAKLIMAPAFPRLGTSQRILH